MSKLEKWIRSSVPWLLTTGSTFSFTISLVSTTEGPRRKELEPWLLEDDTTGARPWDCFSVKSGLLAAKRLQLIGRGAGTADETPAVMVGEDLFSKANFSGGDVSVGDSTSNKGKFKVDICG